MLVLDATPRIYLTTVDRLDLLELVDEDCVVPEPIYDEVVTRGIEAGHLDVRRVQRAVDAGPLSVHAVEQTQLAQRLRHNPNLSEADDAR